MRTSRTASEKVWLQFLDASTMHLTPKVEICRLCMAWIHCLHPLARTVRDVSMKTLKHPETFEHSWLQLEKILPDASSMQKRIKNLENSWLQSS